MSSEIAIEFYLDAKSGIAPYLQLVQQVRRALKLGALREGDLGLTGFDGQVGCVDHAA
jgi:hypothetical protein